MKVFLKLFFYKLVLHLFRHLFLISVGHQISHDQPSLMMMLTFVEYALIIDFLWWWLGVCCEFYQLLAETITAADRTGP